MKLKKIIVVLLIFLYILSFCPASKANDDGIMPLESTTPEGTVQRECSFGEYDAEKDAYPFTYRIYNGGGLQEGTVFLPSSYYNSKNYFMAVSDTNEVFMFFSLTQNGSTQRVQIAADAVDFELGFRLYFGQADDFDFRKYNFDTNTFGGNNRVSVWYGDKYRTLLNPNNIVLVKNLNITYGWTSLSYNLCQDFLTLRVPELEYKQEGAFRIYLHDFYGSLFEGEAYTVDNALTGLQLFVYDLNSKTYLTENLNVLSVSDLSQDERNRYYVDVKFTDVLPYLNTRNGDYLITLGTTLRSTKILNALKNASNASAYNFKTNYTTIDYWRYKYSTAAGRLWFFGFNRRKSELRQHQQTQKTQRNQTHL